MTERKTQNLALDSGFMYPTRAVTCDRMKEKGKTAKQQLMQKRNEVSEICVAQQQQKAKKKK